MKRHRLTLLSALLSAAVLSATTLHAAYPLTTPLPGDALSDASLPATEQTESGQAAQPDCASLYRSYPAPTLKTTAPPSGYKPVHLAAYSRHGSRYLTTRAEYGDLLEILEGRETLGLLTPEGKAFLEDVRKIMDDAEGNYGSLNSQGIRELQGIMSRTCQNYPQIFSGKDAEIEVYASEFPRCLMSMAYSLDVITAFNPTVKYVRHSTPRTQLEYFSLPMLSNIRRNYGPDFSRRLIGCCDPTPLAKVLFTDGGRSLDRHSLEKLPVDIWNVAGAATSAGYPGVDVFSYFPENALDPIWQAENRRRYFNYGPSAEFREVVRDQMKPLLRTLIDSADRSLEGNGPRATLFYGHDSGIMPLAVLMDIKGCCDAATDTDHPETAWNDGYVAPMAANIQMVLYAKKGASTLVKVLHNEREAQIEGLTPISGPYYKWSDLRGKYMDEIENGPSFSKDGWQTYEVQEGVKYMRYSGADSISRSNQMVYAVDVDMNNPRYKVKFSYENRISTSDAFKKAGAIATINATYEKESVFIKVDGKTHHCIESLTVPGKDLTPVPQWKTDCAICTDGRRVEISYAGKDLTPVEQRSAYESLPWDNVFTSAPMLIDNYIPVGKYFAAPNYTNEELEALRYEDPTRHQGVRHPRCAAAITEDNHLIIIAVDGRRPGIAEGMNCWEFTSFIEKHFKPSYAMNLDGGGSTAMCVKGFGAPETNVVNYPSGGRDFTHGAQRKVPTHIHIIDTQE